MPALAIKQLPTLRRELIAAFALIFAGAFLVAVTGALFMLPRFESATQAIIFLAALLISDIAVFVLFGHILITRRVLQPIDRLVAGAEAIARGDLDASLPDAETREMAQLSKSLNDMARRLIDDQDTLAANIRSLDETNILLTEARDAMIHSEKLASAGRLGAGIAHEVGNPLGAIIGYLGVLRKQASERQLEMINSAEQEAHRIDRIVRGLLDYSRPREARPQPLDVNEVLRSTVELVSTQGKLKQIRLDVELENDLPVVTGDPYQLQQVLVNLLVNAADALEDQKDPRVRLSTMERAHQLSSWLPARRKEDHPAVDYSHRRRLHATTGAVVADPGTPGSTVVEIVVSDNGPGIPPDLIDKIFEPFVTTKEVGKGTGLGLAVCARLIEGMGGVIRADASEDGGATFRIVLPVQTSEDQTTT